MSKKNQAIVERVLKNFAEKQVNLSSESARDIISRAIIKALDIDEDTERRSKIREDWMRAMEKKRKSMEKKSKKR